MAFDFLASIKLGVSAQNGFLRNAATFGLRAQEDPIAEPVCCIMDIKDISLVPEQGIGLSWFKPQS